MVRFRRTGLLICFYCGGRTTLRNDGSTREFTCTNCDATNYLDHNGEITDPPVATEREAPAQLFTQISTNPQPDNIFCATCLKNQRLHMASLAQYYPDDPSDPDSTERERKYYQFRKRIDEQYPQVCDVCLVKVEKKIQDAKYTAQTDHLRRMADRTRQVRGHARRRTTLDVASQCGKWMWWSGLGLQLLWHAVHVVAALNRREAGMYDPDDESWTTKLVKASGAVAGLLPGGDVMIWWSIWMSLASAWWNPHFVQLNRGFTRHLLGFTQWYSFQGLIVFTRFIAREVVGLEGGKSQSKYAQLSAHLAMMILGCFMHTLAQRSIKVDTRPLFGPYTPSKSPIPTTSARQSQIQEPKSFSESLNDALDSPSLRTIPGQLDLNPLPAPYPPSNPVRQNHSLETPSRQTSRAAFGSPELNVAQNAANDEMDWTPTQSQHRAFSNQSFSAQAKQSFNHSPTAPTDSPFWYKAPAEPSHPSHRLHNSSLGGAAGSTSFMRPKPAETTEQMAPLSFASQARNGFAAQKNSPLGTFQNPRFFAPEKNSDEANSLADMLGSNFSLGKDEASNVPLNGHAKGQGSKAHAMITRGFLKKNLLEMMTLIMLILMWTLFTKFSFSNHLPYPLPSKLIILGIAGLTALRTMDKTKQALATGRASAAASVGSLLAVAELTVVCWVGLEVWRVAGSELLNGDGGEGWKGRDEFMLGMGVLGTMLGHQVVDGAS